MKMSEIVKRVNAGFPLFVVEYRNLKKDTMEYRDKKTGNMVKKDTLKHLLEFGDGGRSLEVMVWLEDGVSPDSVKQPFKRGEKCVFTADSLQQIERGSSAYTGTGTFEALTPE